MTEPLVLNGPYRILDYFASHSQLLIRGEEKRGDQRLNVDLRFYGVKYVCLPAYFDSPIIRLSTEAEVTHVAVQVAEPHYHPEFSSVYIVETDSHVHYIIAAGIEVKRNGLPPLESSLTRW